MHSYLDHEMVDVVDSVYMNDDYDEWNIIINAVVSLVH